MTSPTFVSGFVLTIVLLSLGHVRETESLSTSTTTPTPPTNKYELKFSRMIAELTLSPSAIECIDSTKQRTLFRGVAAATSDPQIQNAFSIVYRDLAPIRVAGDLLFGQLSTVASQAEEQADGALVKADEEVLAASRLVFDYFDGDGSGGLDREELLGSPELMKLVRTEEEGTAEDDEEAVVDRFMLLADENGDGVISFVEFANATATRPQLRSVDEALTTAMMSAASGGGVEGKPKRRGAFGLRKSPDERFDAMLEQCLQWERDLGCAPDDTSAAESTAADEAEECAVDVQILERLDEGEMGEEDGRLLQVLKGSLVGARCEPVVEALKMCYLDYSPLRLGGDIIFKLLTRIVKTQIPKDA